MPPRKRAKPTETASAATSAPERAHKRTVRRRKGCLQDLPEFAVEVQLEVFSNLHPRDLLNLSRTCKKFRAFFLHPSNERLWKAARETVGGIPEPPPFLSEPAFINLLFFPYCHNCGQANIQRIIWEWFVRYCPKCLLSMSYEYDDASRKIFQVDRHITFAEHRALEDIFWVHLTKDKRFLNSSTSQYYRIHKPQVDALVEDLRQAGCPVPAEVRTQLVTVLQNDRLTKQQHAKRCVAWYNRQKADRAADLDVKRDERFKEILERLRNSEWEKEIDSLNEFQKWDLERIPGVRQAAKLTPSSWRKTLKAVEPTLQKFRKNRLDKERGDVLRPRFLNLEQAMLAHYVQLPRVASMDCRPEYVDLALMEECRAIADVLADQTVTREDFAAIVPMLAARWEQERKNELLAALSKYIPPVADDVDPLNLAFAIFPCTHCSSRSTFPFFHYPAVLAHQCAHSRHGMDLWLDPDGFDIEYDGDDVLFVQAADVYKTAAITPDADPDRFYPAKRIPFALKNMLNRDSALARAVRNLRNIVKALGLDPACATVEELRKCKARVQCVHCRRFQAEGLGDDGNKVYTWEAALQHAWSNDYMLIEHDQWERVSADDMPTVENAEAHEHGLSLSMPGSVWACSLCVNWDEKAEKSEKIKAHLQEMHEITYSDDCMRDGTIYLHPGKSLALLRPAIRVLV
ncbi:hypothetical protein C8Q74DRAFT_568686 [Fomes fomentarius]|nr:hypothetical protein C8Q74DRAFT_568686 [Fomes fomentarius]